MADRKREPVADDGTSVCCCLLEKTRCAWSFQHLIGTVNTGYTGIYTQGCDSASRTHTAVFHPTPTQRAAGSVSTILRLRKTGGWEGGSPSVTTAASPHLPPSFPETETVD